MTASTFKTIGKPAIDKFDVAPNLAADSLAVSACEVHTATSSRSGSASSAGRWARGDQP